MCNLAAASACSIEEETAMNHAQELAAASLYNLATVFAGHVRNDLDWAAPAINANDSWPAVVVIAWGHVAVRLESRDIGGFTMRTEYNHEAPDLWSVLAEFGPLDLYVRNFR
jgi:hypothetical protein